MSRICSERINTLVNLFPEWAAEMQCPVDLEVGLAMLCAVAKEFALNRCPLSRDR
jgi:hypothetical protein